MLSFPFHFLLLSLSPPSPFLSDVRTCWMALQRYIILRCLVFCVMIPWVNGPKCDNLLQFNTSCLGSLGTWYYFRLCFSFSYSGYDLTLIKKSHTLNFYSFLQKFLLKITVVAQFTAKTTNSEKAISRLFVTYVLFNK